MHKILKKCYRVIRSSKKNFGFKFIVMTVVIVPYVVTIDSVNIIFVLHM